MWQRTLSIYVDVPEEWLLPNGEALTHDNAVAAEAWQELRKDVVAKLEGLYHGKRSARPVFVDVDWEDEPENVGYSRGWPD